MAFVTADLLAFETWASVLGRPVSTIVNVPFNLRLLRALRRIAGVSEGATMGLSFNDEVRARLATISGSLTPSALGAEPAERTVVAKTGDYVITVADIEAGSTVRFIPAGSSATGTLPAVAGWTGRSVRIANAATVGSGKTVIVDGDGSETVAGDATITLNPGDAYTFESDGTRVLVY